MFPILFICGEEKNIRCLDRSAVVGTGVVSGGLSRWDQLVIPTGTAGRGIGPIQDERDSSAADWTRWMSARFI